MTVIAEAVVEVGLFSDAADSVAKQFTTMSRSELFVVDATIDELYAEYIGSFPDGTNPFFRKATEHECSCCRSFIKRAGNVVSIKGGVLTTIWDAPGLQYPYDVVARRMSDLVRSKAVRSTFLTKEMMFGSKRTFDYGSSTESYNHFYCDVPAQFRSTKVGEDLGKKKSLQGVLWRGMTEIDLPAIDKAVELIAANKVYRGAEFLARIKSYRDLMVRFHSRDRAVDPSGNLFAWENVHHTWAGLKNDAVGSFLVDLSEGVSQDEDLTKVAIAKFKTKMDPLNYQRSTAPVSARMVVSAGQQLADLGLETAVARRHASLSDISINDILFVDNGTQGKLKDGLVGLLADVIKAPQVDVKSATDISIDEFVSTVLPKVTSVKAVLSPAQLSNFVSVTAPVDPEAGRLFKWDNGFAWSYDGDATDSIKARVKAAGGSVTGLMRVSLAWFNHDDLDLHAHVPYYNEVYFHNKGPAGHRILDVDMNAGDGTTRTPVENMAFDATTMRDGDYEFWVENYAKRENSNVGFTLEYEHAGKTVQYSYPNAVNNKGNVRCLKVKVKDKKVVTIVANPALKVISGTDVVVEKWGIKTGVPVKVDLVMSSPNHWDGAGAYGNKHTIFVLDGAKNPETVRGIYNEFLRPEFFEHRKVFEAVGDKTKACYADEQLSGVGFSAGRGDHLTVIVSGDINRAYNIKF